MPILSRLITCPISIDVRRGAVSGLAGILSDRRISSNGRVAVAVGPGQGRAIVDQLRPAMAEAEYFEVRGGSVHTASQLQLEMRARGGSYDTLVGIGGGRTLDVAKFAAARMALPMVAVATNLAHDGIASPVASLDHDSGKGSFGVAMPIAVIVDLDYVAKSPIRMVRAGVGDVLSNLTAIEDWFLAERERDERIDGVSITLARMAAEAIVHRIDGVEDFRFLTTLAESLIMSGLAMAAAGSSRPCSGGDHEVVHAINMLHPQVSNHGELAGIGALFSCFLRDDESLFRQINQCLLRHALPRGPEDVGLTQEEFAAALLIAPSTRPDRYTILEHKSLNETQLRVAVGEYCRLLRSDDRD